MIENENLSQAQRLGKMYGGMQGRKAAMLFEYKTLTWIAKFKFTNYQVISRLFSISPSTARDKLKRLEKRGLIRKVPCMSVRDSWVYIMSQAGVNILREHWNGVAPNAWLDVTKIRDRTKATHDLCVQYFCAAQHSSGDTKSVKSEFEIGETPCLKVRLPAGNKKNLRHKPDAIITHWQNSDNMDSKYLGDWAVEFESVRKSVSRLEEIFSYHYRHCMSEERHRLYWGVHYIFSRMSDAVFYEKQLRILSKRLFPIKWNHQEGKDEYDENEDVRQKFLECFTFHMKHKEFQDAFYHRDIDISLNL